MAKKKTSMFPDQPAENNIHAGEEIAVVEKPSATPSTSVDSKAAEDAREELDMDEFTISPYTCAPVVIDCGPGLASYHVPKHLLRSPKWSTTDAGGIIQLSNVSATTGHTLVHYLYTGTYQSLETKGKDVASPAHIKFEQALMAFILASAYELPDFKRLAKEQISMVGGSMTLVEVLHTAKKWFPKMARSWFHEYLQTRAKEQFSLDYRYFTHRAYIESVGDGKLQGFMAQFLLDVFTKKLTHTLQRGESLDEGPTEVEVDGAEDAAGQSEVSFEFVDASCEDTVAVISLGDQAWGETTHVPRESTPMPSPGPLTESEAQPKLAPGLPPAEQEWVGHKEKEEEEVERKRKEEEEAAAAADAAAAASKAADLRWANETPANNNWGSFAATTTGKKKGKKGKAKPTPPTPPPPAEPPTTFDDIKLDDGAPKIDMNFSDPKEKPPEDDGWGFGATTTKKKKGKKGALIEESISEPEPAPAPEPVKKEEDDPWAFSFGSTSKDKKKTKKKKKGAVEESPPEPEPEPEPVPEPEFVKEDDPWGFAATTGKKKKKTSVVEEEPPPPPPEPEPEPLVEPEPSPPAEDKPADGWDDWGAAITTTKKKKKKKDVVEEEPPPPPPEPEPEAVVKPETESIPEPEPVEDKNDGGDWGFSSIWGGGKKKKGLKKDTRVEEEEEPGTEVVVMEEEERMHESIPEVSRVLCPYRSYHFAEVNGWKSCERCRTMIRAFAAQLEKEETAVTLLQ